MKMAALQLMQQKAIKDNKTEACANTDAPGSDAETVPTQTNAAEASTGSTNQADGSAAAASHTETDREENPSKLATNGPIVLSPTQNGECKSPVGKELEESIPGLAQAKELAETLVTEDGSCIGRSTFTPNRQPGQCRDTKNVFYWHS